MAYGVSLQSFQNKEISQFPRVIVWSIFGSKARLTNEGWALMYDNRNGGILYLDDDILIDGCSVMRPSADAVRDLYALACRVPSAISQDDRFFVTNAAIIPGMPDWLLNALPKSPQIVLSSDELLERLAQG